MSENNLKRQTYGNFELRGKITVGEDSFFLNQKGSNNKNFIYHRMNLRMDDGKGGNFFLNVMDGYDSVKGKKIFAQIKDGNFDDNLEVSFADRHNPEILKNIDDRAFIRVAVDRIEDENGKKVFDYKHFLTMYDAIEFLKENLKSDMIVYVRGQQRFSKYNDNLNKDLTVKTFLVLPAEEEHELGFKFNQQILLDKDSVDTTQWEKENVAYIKSKLYYTKYNKETQSKEPNILVLPLVVRATDDKKEVIKKMIDKFLKVEGSKVRRIQVEGYYNSGYAQGNVKLEDLPPEALELIEDGIYTEEEVQKIYANRNRVDEMVVVRPVIIRKEEGDLPKVDMDDNEFEESDLNSLPPEVEEVEIKVEEEDLTFLDDL
ncbi:hypothetical protein [Halalkalibacter oceani]|uniref:hypothetical protein n=1 Tax=Halalkalibacter oceani TaxID=1653776 RepID=UPI00339321CD